MEIRKELTEALQQIDPKSPAVAPIRSMRAACRQYLDGPRQRFRHMDRFHDAGFFVALGEMRAVFGAELKRLDDRYNLDIESHIRAIFPMPDKK
jgi:hypothetical protein